MRHAIIRRTWKLHPGWNRAVLSMLHAPVVTQLIAWWPVLWRKSQWTTWVWLFSPSLTSQTTWRVLSLNKGSVAPPSSSRGTEVRWRSSIMTRWLLASSLKLQWAPQTKCTCLSQALAQEVAKILAGWLRFNLYRIPTITRSSRRSFRLKLSWCKPIARRELIRKAALWEGVAVMAMIKEARHETWRSACHRLEEWLLRAWQTQVHTIAPSSIRGRSSNAWELCQTFNKRRMVPSVTGCWGSLSPSVMSYDHARIDWLRRIMQDPLKPCRCGQTWCFFRWKRLKEARCVSARRYNLVRYGVIPTQIYLILTQRNFVYLFCVRALHLRRFSNLFTPIELLLRAAPQ